MQVGRDYVFLSLSTQIAKI